jgi:predicted helicase
MSDIKHAHLYGTREAKYDWLLNHNVSSTDWTKLEPQEPFSLFTPQDNRLFPEYAKGWKISDAMPVTSAGIKTNRDHLLIDFKFPVLLERIKNLAEKIISDDEIKKLYNLVDSEYWNTARERQKIRTTDWQKSFTSILYRPFDIRSLFYQQNLIEIGRGGAATKVMGHMIRGQNLGLVATRQFTGSEFYHILCSSVPIEMKTCSHDRGTSFFPLYVIPDPNNPQKSTVKEQRRPNLSDEFLTEITNKLGYTPTPEAIFYYIYAIFHSPTYRTRYAEFLKIDFPRVPLTSNDQLFRKLGEYGEELVALHLMKSPKLDQHLTQIIDKGGEFIVDAGHPKYSDGEVIINKKGDRFTGVPKSVWEFYVGGYQVCHKWLKDRKGRQLSPEDLNHYQKIIVALSETMQIMNAIDAAIPSFPIE